MFFGGLLEGRYPRIIFDKALHGFYMFFGGLLEGRYPRAIFDRYLKIGFFRFYHYGF